MRSWYISILAMTAFLLFGVTVFSQSAEQTPVYLIGANCSGTPPAKMWMKGGIVHVRSQAALHGLVSDNPLLTGTDMMVFSYNYNTKTGKGNLYGQITLYPADVEGTWEGTLSGHTRDGRTFLQIVAHGTGVLFGQTLKYDAEVSIPAGEVPGLPADICAGYPLDPPNVGFVAEGSILNPHGD